ISSERREGTLGLLLLTRVRAFGVVIGKLGSTATAALGALVALLPLLMVPILAGGVGSGEAFRKGLACINCLFFALAVGLFCSASGRDRFRTAMQSVLGLLCVTFLPVIANAPFQSLGIALFAHISPLFTLLHADDRSYKSSALSFWISLAAVQAAAWLLLKGAALRLSSEPLEEKGPA